MAAMQLAARVHGLTVELCTQQHANRLCIVQVVNFVAHALR